MPWINDPRKWIPRKLVWNAHGLFVDFPSGAISRVDSNFSPTGGPLTVSSGSFGGIFRISVWSEYEHQILLKISIAPLMARSAEAGVSPGQEGPLVRILSELIQWFDFKPLIVY